jgi:O-antigen/teichoic acid export membrane protein
MTLPIREVDTSEKLPGKRLFRNTVWSCLGSAIPMAVAVLAVPRLIHALGADRFGILGLAWMAVGYLSLLDFGLGRAITRLVAERLASGNDGDIPGIFWDANLLLMGLGIAGGLLVWGPSSLLLDHALRIPAALEGEAKSCLLLIAATIPLVVLSNGFRGFLEAYQRFRAVNVLRTVAGIIGVVAPVLLLPWTVRVDVIVAVLCAVRAISVLVYLVMCLRFCPDVWRRRSLGKTPLVPLLRFGGWITVDNLVGPLMVSVDRLVIGSLLSIGMTTYYITPQEILTKLLIIPMGLQQAIFPTFSKVDRAVGASLYRKSVDSILLLMLLPSVASILFARDILTLWIGASFAAQSHLVFQWIAVGILINSVAHIPSSMLQAIGRPEINAVIHICEFFPYLLLIWVLVHHYGIVGAAIAWVVRVSADTVCFLIAGYKVLPEEPMSKWNLAATIAMVAGAALLARGTASLVYRSGFLLLTAVLSLALATPLLYRRMTECTV